MFAERYSIALTTDASGNCTAYSDAIPFGRILSVRYVKTDFDDTADFTITLERAGEAVLALSNQTASGIWYPRVQVNLNDTGGTALTYDGTRKVCEPIPVVADRVKVIIAQGGNTKTGTVQVVVGG